MASGETQYSRSDYDDLITFYVNASDSVQADLMRDPDTDIPHLEQGIIFHPGSTKWELAGLVTSKVQTLGGEFANEYTTMYNTYSEVADGLAKVRDKLDGSDESAQQIAQGYQA